MQVVPAVRALQRRWPDARITWVMGSVEAKLLGDLDGVRTRVFRKGGGVGELSSLTRRLREERSFDVLLHMHASLRANLVSLSLPARVRMGFDGARSRDLQHLFVNRKLPPDPGAHVLEGFASFSRQVGADPRDLRWDIPVSSEDRAFARTHVPDGERVLVVSPASSHPLRNWSVERYAEVATHAIHRHGMRILLCGGPSREERVLAREIEERLPAAAVTNLVGRDTLKSFLAVLQRASGLLSPDSGPAHMASAVGTPVLGLYAATDPERSGPYRSLRWCENRFREAARHLGKDPKALPWGTKLEAPGVMDLIPAGAVMDRLDTLVAELEAGRPVVAPPELRTAGLSAWE